MNTTVAPQAYVHEITGDVKMVTPGQARFLPGYKAVEFMHDKDGKPFMRIKMKGATVDVSEDDRQKVLGNGNTGTK